MYSAKPSLYKIILYLYVYVLKYYLFNLGVIINIQEIFLCM